MLYFLMHSLDFIMKVSNVNMIYKVAWMHWSNAKEYFSSTSTNILSC